MRPSRNSSRSGYAATRLEDVAARANVTKGAFSASAISASSISILARIGNPPLFANVDRASGQAAFLEFFSAAAGTGIVASDVSQGIAMRHPERIRQPPIGRVLARRLRLEDRPTPTFPRRFAEQSEIAVSIQRLGFGMVDRILQVLFEILECEPFRIDRPALKSLLAPAALARSIRARPPRRSSRSRRSNPPSARVAKSNRAGRPPSRRAAIRHAASAWRSSGTSWRERTRRLPDPE